jgi:hypothetical protein
MVSENQATVQRSTEAGTVTISARPRWTSEAAIDIALLVCALFLQRFSLPFGHTFLSLDIVPVVFILAHQFASGRLLIYYDRLLWFLALGFVVTCSLLLNYKNEMLSSYFLFIVMYFLFTLSRPATVERYKSTLQAFQFLVLVLAYLAIAQFFAQFVVDGRELVQFFGLIPDFLLGTYTTGGVNTIIPITGSLIKSNGIFLNEPSVLSQMTALAILIEILGFRRLGYLFPLVFGYLVSYSGSGLMMLLLFLPLTVLADMRMILYGLLLAFFVFVLSVAGIVDLSVFVARSGEFYDTNASGFSRFVAPFWVAADYLELASARALLLGNGPGTTAGFLSGFWYGGMTGTPIKLFYEYGLIGSFVFILFIAQCCRGTLCPRLVVAAIFCTYVLGGSLLATPYLTILIVLLTLSRRERHRRYEKRAQPPNPSAAGRSSSINDAAKMIPSGLTFGRLGGGPADPTRTRETQSGAIAWEPQSTAISYL